MAHFAQLDDNNKVLQVIVIDNNETHDENGVEQEELGIAFCKKIFGTDTKWVQTSYNANTRSKYAGVGDIYDPVKDEFIVDEETNAALAIAQAQAEAELAVKVAERTALLNKLGLTEQEAQLLLGGN